MIAAEQPDATVALLAQGMVPEDRLGVAPESMRLLLWQRSADEMGERRQAS
ncbi:hypothetical protein [Micromonospora sp. DT53]|uniref:hypothetical protein n=1 Tax=Micromonospora sp. DT53 TaxID=3393444 RepID=UPI003CE8E7FB